MITHALKFASEDEALKALPDFWIEDPETKIRDWRRDCVDGPFEVLKGTGQFTTDPETGASIEVMTSEPGYFLNIALPELNQKLSGLVGAWEVPGKLLWGEAPKTPSRVFA